MNLVLIIYNADLSNGGGGIQENFEVISKNQIFPIVNLI